MPRANTNTLCLIAGNSGSLLDLPPQAAWPPHVLYGTNRLLRPGLDGRRYAPGWLVVSDRRVVATDRAYWEERGETRLALADFVAAEDGIAAEFTYKTREWNGGANAPPWPASLADPFVQMGNIVLEAVQLAVLHGHNNLVLIGCEGGPYLRGQAHSHFYDRTGFESHLAPFPATLRPHLWLRLMVWAAQYGAKVRSASPWAAPPGVPRVDFADL